MTFLELKVLYYKNTFENIHCNKDDIEDITIDKN